jgi:hypothetical protein
VHRRFETAGDVTVTAMGAPVMQTGEPRLPDVPEATLRAEAPDGPDRRGPIVRSAAVLGHVLVAVAATAPLAWHLDELATGREPAATVPQFNLWTLQWTASRLPHAMAGWWDAPIFSPTPGTFAFSEPQPLTGAAYALVRPLVGDIRGYSLMLLLAIVLNGVAAAALARRLGASEAPAFVTGVLAQTMPFVFGQLGVLQLVSVWPMFAAIACVVAWIGEPRIRWGLLLGLSLAAAVGTCGYYALLFVLCLVIAVPFTLDATWWRDRLARARSAAVAAAVFVVLAGPFLWGQHRRLDGYRWSAATIRAGSAPWHEWGPGGRLWPSLVLIALAALGTTTTWRTRPTRLLVALGGTSFVVSLGSRLSVAGVQPWTELVHSIDAFAGLRSPFRAAALTQVALVALAAPGLQRLRTVLPRLPAIAGAAALVIGLVLTTPGPGPLVPAPASAGRWATWLARHGDHAPVAFLPFAPNPRAESFEPTTTRMLQALDTGHPMINGYSGFFPKDHGRLRQQLVGFPDERSLAALRDRHVRYVVIATDRYDDFDQRIARQLGYDEIVRDHDAVVLRVPTP